MRRLRDYHANRETARQYPFRRLNRTIGISQNTQEIDGTERYFLCPARVNSLQEGTSRTLVNEVSNWCAAARGHMRFTPERESRGEQSRKRSARKTQSTTPAELIGYLCGLLTRTSQTAKRELADIWRKPVRLTRHAGATRSIALRKFARTTSRTASSERSDSHCQSANLGRCNDPNRLDTLTDCRHTTNGIARVTSQTRRINLAENAKLHS